MLDQTWPLFFDTICILNREEDERLFPCTLLSASAHHLFDV